MICSKCGKETAKLKGSLCRACFMVASIEDEQMVEAIDNDLPKKYHTPLNPDVSSVQVFINMSKEYQARYANKNS